MNTDYQIGYDLILNEVPAGSRVLDLGCGDGALLERLQNLKKVKGFGVEISEEGVSKCVEKGLYCYQGDIDDGLSDFKQNIYDFIILNQTLQSTKRPDYVLKEIMRICRTAIISFPNFGHCKTRFQILFRGTMPKNSLLPYEWFESPNIHHLTINDFEDHCEKNRFAVKKEMHFSLKKDGSSRIINFMPNMMAEYGLFVLDGEKFSAEKNIR
ncbi:MAG: methionine biosynthesis protein MetW [Spirochaetes bacterium]|jgi:methionine biosynthesis protein MetW|nr:methionine biosynthesis protein MetW [Spirochaetota bacterium]